MYSNLPFLAETSSSVFHKQRITTSHKELVGAYVLSHAERAKTSKCVWPVVRITSPAC